MANDLDFNDRDDRDDRDNGRPRNRDRERPRRTETGIELQASFRTFFGLGFGCVLGGILAVVVVVVAVICISEIWASHKRSIERERIEAAAAAERRVAELNEATTRHRAEEAKQAREQAEIDRKRAEAEAERVREARLREERAEALRIEKERRAADERARLAREKANRMAAFNSGFVQLADIVTRAAGNSTLAADQLWALGVGTMRTVSNVTVKPMVAMANAVHVKAEADKAKAALDAINKAEAERRKAEADKAKAALDAINKAEAERQATVRLALAESVFKDGKNETARRLLTKIVKDYPDTKAAQEAKRLLQKLDEADK
jgi:hypothetical protein